MDIRQEVITLLERAKADIQAQMQAKKINASGRTSASLHVESYDGGVRLVGGGQDTAPFPTLEIGREGGNVPQGFYYIIKQWSRDKGIQFANESERSTFAYFLARKIAREGTARHKSPEDVYSTIVTRAVANINEVLGRFVNSEVSGSVSGIKSNF